MAKRMRANPFGIIVIIILLAVIGVLSWRLEEADGRPTSRRPSGLIALSSFSLRLGIGYDWLACAHWLSTINGHDLCYRMAKQL